MFTYLDGDKKIAAESAAAYPTVVYGHDILGDPDLARVFKSNADFGKWAANTPHGAKVRSILDTVEKEVPKERRNEAAVEKMQRLAMDHKIKTFEGFAALHGKPPLDESVIRLAMVNKTALTPNIFDPVLLYDHVIEHEPPTGSPENPNTQWLPVPSGYWPYLGWFGWNDRARSVRIFGVNVLCENPWFQGRWCWLIGFNGLLNLGHAAFDRVASSAIAY